MLEKNEKNMYFDAHLHFSLTEINKNIINSENWTGCSCAHSLEEWDNQKSEKNIVKALGIHPQFVNESNIQKIDNLYKLQTSLIKTGELDCIGEIGFDFFTEDFKSNKELQIIWFEKELELAMENKLPVVIHCRKGNELLYKYSSQLKQLPGVIFHSFMGSEVEALSLINRNINCCFSFGKQIMNNNKKVIQCVSKLPLENLLLETDAPYQFLKGEKCTYGEEITKIYEEACKLRQNILFDDFMLQLEKNFKRIFSAFFYAN